MRALRDHKTEPLPSILVDAKTEGQVSIAIVICFAGAGVWLRAICLLQSSLQV